MGHMNHGRGSNFVLAQCTGGMQAGMRLKRGVGEENDILEGTGRIFTWRINIFDVSPDVSPDYSVISAPLAVQERVLFSV